MLDLCSTLAQDFEQSNFLGLALVCHGSSVRGVIGAWTVEIAIFY